MGLRLAYILRFGRFSCSRAGNNHSLSSHELDRFRSFTKAHIRCYRVRRVLLLHVSPDLDAAGPNHATITQKLCSRGLDESLVSYMSVGIAFCANKIQPGCMGHSHRLDVCSSEDLNSDW